MQQEPELAYDPNDPLVRASERFEFESKDAEIEHLRMELAIITKKAQTFDDMRSQNETL